jgi:hypothetical protein
LHHLTSQCYAGNKGRPRDTVARMERQRNPGPCARVGTPRIPLRSMRAPAFRAVTC